jgi:para-aminobenzoate synthetase component I
MHKVDLSANRLVRALVFGGKRNVCVLDSCGVGRPGNNLLIAGVEPVRTVSLTGDAERTLRALDEVLNADDLAAVFTISYDFGLELNKLTKPDRPSTSEPHIFAALFDGLAIHDYDRDQTWLTGDETARNSLAALLAKDPEDGPAASRIAEFAELASNFSRDEYLDAVERVKELICEGETYQTNLTQQLTVPLPSGTDPADVFLDLRRDHPAAFAGYIERGGSTVVSASPEQFVRIENDNGRRRIIASPIKGTRRRGFTIADDERMRHELLTSEKDRAENTMIVDLMRNDLGRLCDFGSVAVDELCRIEEHPTLFHLVSTVTGVLRDDVRCSEIIRAVFPSGSITGAPKIRTMEIIDRLEQSPRGLSMGAIGCRIPAGMFGPSEIFEMSVAIRTMVIRDRTAVFNVGGGIVIDSDPAEEYEESMLKAKALLRALGVKKRAAGTTPLLD